MKLKNTKYILLLLAGIMLATGCGCGDKGKGGAGGDVTELEATEKKLLDDLKPLFVAFKKTNLGGLLTDKQAEEEFKASYSDPERASFVAQWDSIKALLKSTSETGYEQLYTHRNTILNNIASAQKAINDPLASPANDDQKKEKAYLEKALELYKNRLKMIDTLLGVETEKSDSGDSKKD